MMSVTTTLTIKFYRRLKAPTMLKHFSRPYFAPDDPPASGGIIPPNIPSPTPPSTTPAVEDPKLDITQVQMDAIVENRLNQERRVQEQKKADADSVAATEKAKKDGELQTVITAHEATIAGLKTKAELADTYASRINELIESEVKDWPEEVKKLDPGKDDVSTRMKWVDQSRDLASRLKSLGAPPSNLFGQKGVTGQAQPSTAGQQVDKHMASKYLGPPNARKST